MGSAHCGAQLIGQVYLPSLGWPTLLGGKNKELNRYRQSEQAEEHRLHRLQDIYADEIRKHSEDSAKAAQLAKDMETVKDDFEAKIREECLGDYKIQVHVEMPQPGPPQPCSTMALSVQRLPYRRIFMGMRRTITPDWLCSLWCLQGADRCGGTPGCCL